jgi:hypothetical protein
LSFSLFEKLSADKTISSAENFIISKNEKIGNLHKNCKQVVNNLQRLATANRNLAIIKTSLMLENYWLDAIIQLSTDMFMMKMVIWRDIIFFQQECL